MSSTPSAQPSAPSGHNAEVRISEQRDTPFAGAWWPASRSLADEIGDLTAGWPTDRSRVDRILYSRPDWDDQPRRVARRDGGSLKTGSFPSDDTHVVTLVLRDGSRREVLVIPPATDAEVAHRLLADSVTAPGDGATSRQDLLADVS